MTLTELLSVRQLAFQYYSAGLRPGEPSPAQNLAPLSLGIAPGDLLLITGRSGCGKSTLARCLTGLIPHLYRGTMQGEVWIDQLLTVDTPLWRLAELAGLVFQNPAGQMLAHSVEAEILFGLENLGLEREEMKARLEQAISRFNLAHLRDRPPQSLSGGEQQILALAAITARRPPLLVLDEPLSMLDGAAAGELIRNLAELSQQGVAVVICEHRREYLQHLTNLRTLVLPGKHLPAETAPAPNSLRLARDPQTRPLLTVRDLSVQLGGRPVLNGVDFQMEGGQVVALVGRNGAGKTTLLRALSGLQKHQGKIDVNGRRPQLGLVFQNPDLQLFNATVREEILYQLPHPDLDLFDQLVELLGLTPYVDLPPLLLSEGEKKRVALATILMRQPRDGVLLDEPSLGQDSAHKAILMGLARNLAANSLLVLLTTHDLELAGQADRMLLLSPDGIVADGRPHDVLRDRPAWDRLGLPVPTWLPALQEATDD